jgi:hypothetical protein
MRKTLATMTFNSKGRKDIEAFVVRIDAQLNIIRMLYNDDKYRVIINSNRAE